MPPKAKAEKTLDIRYTRVRVQIKGTRPLLMQNGNMVDETSGLALEKKKLTGTSKKAGDGLAKHEKLALLDFRGCVYLDTDGDVCVPGENIVAAIADGGKIRKKGKALYRQVQCFDDVKLSYEGRSKIKSFEDLCKRYQEFSLRKRTKLAGPGGKSVMRTRPKFENWSLDFELVVTLGVEVDLADVRSALDVCGSTIGLGDWHGRYGLFTVEKFEEVRSK